MQKGNFVFEKGHSKKKLDKTDSFFLNEKRPQRQEICNFCLQDSKTAKTKQHTQRKEKRKNKKKKRENSKKGNEQKTPANRKDEKMTEESETKQKQNLQKVHEEVEWQRKHKETMKKPPKNEKHKKWRKAKNKEYNDIYWKNQKRPDQWQLFAHETWLAQPRHDTPQWSTERSLAHAILNACESSNKFSFLQMGFFFLKKIQMIIFGIFFYPNVFALHQKKFKWNKVLENLYFSKEFFFKG